MSKHGLISGPCFPVFSLNTGKYQPEITPYLDTFHAVVISLTRHSHFSPLIFFTRETHFSPATYEVYIEHAGEGEVS